MGGAQDIESAGSGGSGGSSSPAETRHKENFLFGIDIGVFPLQTQVMFCSVGIFISYLLVFVIQESVFKSSNFEYGGLHAFLQFASYAVFGLIHRVLVPQPKRRATLSFFFSLGFYSVAGQAASTYSLQLLNFPTWVLFKSSRVIGVMIGGIFILKKRYSLLEYIGVLLLAVGLVIFTVGDIQLLPAFNPIGILFVLFALVMNSFEGNMQEKGLSEFKATENEMVVFGYGIGALQILPWLLINGEFVNGALYLQQNTYVLLQIAANCVLSYIGVLFVLGLVKISSALTTVIVTSCRKALTVVLSFLLFAKPFSYFYVGGFGTFFIGVFLNIYAKNSEQMHLVWSLLQQRFTQFSTIPITSATNTFNAVTKQV